MSTPGFDSLGFGSPSPTASCPRSSWHLLALVCLLTASPCLAQEHAAPREVSPRAAAQRELGPIGRLLASARPGDTVRVPAGTYQEHLWIDKPVTLVADGSVTIDGGGSGDIIEVVAPDVTIRGFVIRNTGIDLDQENAAIRVLGPRVTLESNVLQDILFGIDLRESPDSRIIANTIGGKRLDIARRGRAASLACRPRHDRGQQDPRWPRRDPVVLVRCHRSRKHRPRLPVRPPPHVQR